MASIFYLIFIMMLSYALAAQNFVPVSVCPRDKYTWDLESVKKKCQGDTPDYLCAAIENQVGKYGEICTKFGLSPANKCAVLNEQTYNLDSVDCKAVSGCPQDPYIPSELWKYQICYEDFYGTTTTLAPITTPNITSTAAASSGSEDGGPGSGARVALTVVTSLIFVSVVVIVVIVVFVKVRQLYTGLGQCCQHNEHEENVSFAGLGQCCQHNEHEENVSFADEDDTKQKTKKLSELHKYLVHILKQELGIKDLNEKAVIHSKSINEHFSEPLIKELQSVKELNDYSNFDMSLVFALLRNFCEGIKPPSRGWDYEPPDDETTVGADIERIRSMWNKFCDNDSQFKHLDKVYNRMTQKYGTVAVHGDDSSKVENNPEGSEVVMEKIQSFKLNPDCTVEKGIVITENISTALKIIKSRNVVILKGVIGCGKTHALKAIQNNFQGNCWETAWLESERFQDKISHEKPTILLCDNFFGRYGSNVFSQDVVNKTEKVLKEIDSLESKTKVVIGMHTHVYDEVKQNLNLNFLHQKNITVEMDNLSEAETLLIFKEQLKWGHCKKDPSCWFKTVGFQSVLGKITKNQGHIGGPFLSLMYCNQHELFSDETFSVNPIQTLMQHFQRMRQDSATLYTCLLYLMCVQEHNCDKDPEEWAGLISADITNLKLQDVATTSSYVQMKTNEETLVHEILTIVLFKSAAETSVEIFKPVVERCKLGFMLQILRPDSTHNNDLYCGFMNVDKKSDFRKIGKIFVRRCVIEKTLDINHPLRTLEFVQKWLKK